MSECPKCKMPVAANVSKCIWCSAPLGDSIVREEPKPAPGCLSVLLGAIVWIVFFGIVFFPGAGPIGRNSVIDVLTLLLPVVAMAVYVPFGVAPFAGVVNAVFCAAVTKGHSTAESNAISIAVSLLWFLPIAIHVIVDKLQSKDSRKDNA